MAHACSSLESDTSNCKQLCKICVALSLDRSLLQDFCSSGQQHVLLKKKRSLFSTVPFESNEISFGIQFRRNTMIHSGTARLFWTCVLVSFTFQILVSQTWSPSLSALFLQPPSHPQSQISRGIENVAVVSIFRNEASYLLEWLCYHLIQGISHFYLYNHLSTDDYMFVLQPFIDRGLVTFNNATEVMNELGDLQKVQPMFNNSLSELHLLMQSAALKHFHRRYSKSTEWVISFDVDEFLFLDQQRSLSAILEDAQQNGAGGVMIERIPFSTNGTARKIPRSQLALMTYLERKKESLLQKEFGKIYYNTKLQTSHIQNLHLFQDSSGPLVDVSGRSYFSSIHLDNHTKIYKPLTMLHHLARSFNECEEKRRLSASNRGAWRHLTSANYCAKLHRGSNQYAAGMFIPDERIRRGVEKQKNLLCRTMWTAHQVYCQKWKCCGWEAFDALNQREI